MSGPPDFDFGKIFEGALEDADLDAIRTLLEDGGSTTPCFGEFLSFPMCP